MRQPHGANTNKIIFIKKWDKCELYTPMKIIDMVFGATKNKYQTRGKPLGDPLNFSNYRQNNSENISKNP
jgi:hypothetical protein